MFIFGSKSDSNVMERLTVLAMGDIDLVQEAIRAATRERPGKPADIQKVVDYILKHRGRSRLAQAG